MRCLQPTHTHDSKIILSKTIYEMRLWGGYNQAEKVLSVSLKGLEECSIIEIVAVWDCVISQPDLCSLCPSKLNAVCLSSVIAHQASETTGFCCLA